MWCFEQAVGNQAIIDQWKDNQTKIRIIHHLITTGKSNAQIRQLFEQLPAANLDRIQTLLGFRISFSDIVRIVKNWHQAAGFDNLNKKREWWEARIKAQDQGAAFSDPHLKTTSSLKFRRV